MVLPYLDGSGSGKGVGGWGKGVAFEAFEAFEALRSYLKIRI